MKRCIASLLLLVLAIGLSGCEFEQRIPTDGVWYCEELQAQFTVYERPGYVDPDWRPVADEQGNYVDENESYIIIGGDELQHRGQMTVGLLEL